MENRGQGEDRDPVAEVVLRPTFNSKSRRRSKPNELPPTGWTQLRVATTMMETSRNDIAVVATIRWHVRSSSSPKRIGDITPTLSRTGTSMQLREPFISRSQCTQTATSNSSEWSRAPPAGGLKRVTDSFEAVGSFVVRRGVGDDIVGRLPCLPLDSRWLYAEG